MRGIHVLSLLLVMVGSAEAADCDPAKFFDTNIQLKDDISKLVYFENLSNDKFEELKKSGQLGATIPIYGVPVQFSGSYGESRTAAEQLRRLLNINYTEEHHTAIYSNMLSDKGLEGYRLCLTNGIGVSLIRSREPLSSAKFSIDVEWHGPIANPEGTFEFEGKSPFHVTGGSVVGHMATNPPRKIRTGEKIAVDIQRTPSMEDFDFRVKISGVLEHLHLPAYQPKDPTWHVRNTATQIANSVGGQGGNNWAHVDIRCLFQPPPSEEFIVGTQHLEAVNDNVVAYSEIGPVETGRIFWRVFAGSNSKAHGAQSRAYVSVITGSSMKTPDSNASPASGCVRP